MFHSSPRLLCTFPIHLTPNGIFLWSCRYGGYEGKLASHILLSQKPDPKEKQVINLDQDVQVSGYFSFWWMVDELICMIPLSPFFSLFFLDMGYVFLLLLTCLVGMWHTFFGYASFFSCLVGMWHTFFGHASFISFCIARILDGNLEKESHVMAWSLIF